ncbi:MAG TPA: DUF4169 family protein [Alphaproteobacteria bacterium]|nr:DUF4169 family protein [Alphaproteobacteria bacterium]
MAELINLRRARKAKARVAAAQAATENRARFGRPLAEKRRDAREAERAQRTLDGAKLESNKPND